MYRMNDGCLLLESHPELRASTEIKKLEKSKTRIRKLGVEPRTYGDQGTLYASISNYKPSLLPTELFPDHVEW